MFGYLIKVTWIDSNTPNEALHGIDCGLFFNAQDAIDSAISTIIAIRIAKGENPQNVAGTVVEIR